LSELAPKSFFEKEKSEEDEKKAKPLAAEKSRPCSLRYVVVIDAFFVTLAIATTGMSFGLLAAGPGLVREYAFALIFSPVGESQTFCIVEAGDSTTAKFIDIRLCSLASLPFLTPGPQEL
jgi:hypothetical protein